MNNYEFVINVLQHLWGEGGGHGYRNSAYGIGIVFVRGRRWQIWRALTGNSASAVLSRTRNVSSGIRTEPGRSRSGWSDRVVRYSLHGARSERNNAKRWRNGRNRGARATTRRRELMKFNDFTRTTTTHTRTNPPRATDTRARCPKRRRWCARREATETLKNGTFNVSASHYYYCYYYHYRYRYCCTQKIRGRSPRRSLNAEDDNWQ